MLFFLQNLSIVLNILLIGLILLPRSNKTISANVTNINVTKSNKVLFFSKFFVWPVLLVFFLVLIVLNLDYQ